MNAGQRAAAEEILTSRDVVQGLEGRAGVGKTTLLKSVREAAEQRGYVVEGFAPTSRAANQLRDAGISADTLQGFLVRARQPTADRHLYMVDESSLASTKQVRDFLAKLDSGDRVLLIGDTRQHQGVEAGKPFEQLVNAGMRTAQLDQIVRQREAPELLKAVEHLSRGEIAEGVALLEQQGRVTEIADPQQRIAAIARSYAASPENTIVVSPDNASRRQINQAVRSELQALGKVASEDHAVRVLAPRSDMTGADRTWAARYAVDDVLYYPRGSQDIGIERQSYAKVIATQPKENLLTVSERRWSHRHLQPCTALWCKRLPRVGAGICGWRPFGIHRPVQRIRRCQPRPWYGATYCQRQPTFCEDGQREVGQLRRQPNAAL